MSSFDIPLAVPGQELPYPIAAETDEEIAFAQAAKDLAAAKHRLAEEYLLHAAGGTKSWDAQQMAEARWGQDVVLTQAAYEIALNRLKQRS